MINQSRENSKKKIKYIGTNKLNFTCPAQIIVIQDNNKITVNYNDTRFGYGCEAACMC